jgi:hypothetical protein
MNKKITRDNAYQVAWDASCEAGQEAAEQFGEGGPCGFAWIIIKPGTSSFARWLVKEHHANPDHYYGGVNIRIADYQQCLGASEEYARAFSLELRKYYPDLHIKPMSRMD